MNDLDTCGCILTTSFTT